MTSRERLLIALDNGKPDRLPCQVHGWTKYYLDTYLGGIDEYEAYKRFGMDSVIYSGPGWKPSKKALANWQVDRKYLGLDDSGNRLWVETIVTPGGILIRKGASNAMTEWETEVFIKTKDDFELFKKYYPFPEHVDFTPVIEAHDKIGDDGIVRCGLCGYGQAGAWQSFCFLVGTEAAIMYAIDEPDWVHYVEHTLVEKQLPIIEKMKGMPADLIETGGGAGSNTVISPSMHKEFCTHYDRILHDAIHSIGFKIVYHLCGGMMKQLDTVVANTADAFETMTPPGMGGDCDLAEANRLVGDKISFIGGFDQSAGFERGTVEETRQQVFKLHAACPNGGYICSPSDHFFNGKTENIQAFVDAAKECVY